MTDLQAIIDNPQSTPAMINKARELLVEVNTAPEPTKETGKMVIPKAKDMSDAELQIAWERLATGYDYKTQMCPVDAGAELCCREQYGWKQGRPE